MAFFVHGVLDTSIGWVANGTTGSQAFGAWDQGFDVWLGNSRNNSPRDHTGAGDSLSYAIACHNAVPPFGSGAPKKLAAGCASLDVEPCIARPNIFPVNRP